MSELWHAARRWQEPVLVEDGATELLGVSVGTIYSSVVKSGRGVILRPRRCSNIVSAQFERWSRKAVAASALLGGGVTGQARLDVDVGMARLPDDLRLLEHESCIFVTSKGLRTPLHSDPSDGMLVHVAGRKRFVFVHPSDSDADPRLLRNLLRLRRKSGSVDHIYCVNPPEELRNMRYFVGDLRPGDAVFVPRRWLHDFESMDATISLAFRFVNIVDASNKRIVGTS